LIKNLRVSPVAEGRLSAYLRVPLVLHEKRTHANLKKLPPKAVGSLRVGQVEVLFSGEAKAIAALQDRFYMKTMRAGA
jgi:hypothetical protein